ncbi:MAG TPA: hypothetical protein DDX39_01305 [Bacteroidales bacterium]|nr:MAG: hypothetical protein A2W98_07515 [Bacteroidetes bacterium GWF2_33_38]OFY69393.1 MAG: hypothetical protein A2265_11920 [Bacteroidetes bacterium RIFOXYA12_FULL_33_9]HBF87249.1 hypothetical protein [Bacteroidales bacterium]
MFIFSSSFILAQETQGNNTDKKNVRIILGLNMCTPNTYFSGSQEQILGNNFHYEEYIDSPNKHDSNKFCYWYKAFN